MRGATLSLSKLNSRSTRKRITAVIALLSIIVVSGVFWWLRYEGITMADEAFCGFDEHTHNDECLADNCTLAEHIHTASCYSNVAADVETAAVWEATFNKQEFTEDVAADMVAVATSQLGYTESSLNFDIDDSGTRCGYTRYGEWYGNKYGHWSAMFVSFCLNYARVTDDSALINSGSAAMLTSWQDAGLMTEYPVAGDIVFIDAKGKGSCTDVGVVVATGNTITVIQGNSNDKVEKLTYSVDDSKIIGYGSVYLALEQTLTENETDRVEFVRGLADEIPTEDKIVDKIAELGSGTELETWQKELAQQIKGAYYYYDLLPAKLQPLVYNANKILDLNFIWQSSYLDGTESSASTSELVITVHQINVYETYNQYAYPETHSTISTGQVSESIGPKYPWWHAFVIEKHPDGYFYVAKINRNLGDAYNKGDMVAQTEEGFVYLVWNEHPLAGQTKSIEIGNIVKINPEAMLKTTKASAQTSLGELTFIIGSDRYVKKDINAVGTENIALGKKYNMSLLFADEYRTNSNWDGVSPVVNIIYPDEGNATLTDGKIAPDSDNYYLPEWMGFNIASPDYKDSGIFVNVDLGKVYDVGKVVLYCGSIKLGGGTAGIAAPKEVSFYGSVDGSNYELIGTVAVNDDSSKACLEVSLRCNTQARYIKAQMEAGSYWVFVCEFEAYENFKAPTVIGSANTLDLIDLNLYDYGNNINFPYYHTYTDANGEVKEVHNQYYPGFAQGGGTLDTYDSLNLNQFNFGDSIHLNRESGEYGITANANKDRENTGKINQINKDNPANLPILDAMYPKLVNNYPATLDSDNKPLSLAYLFDGKPYDFEPNDNKGAEVYSVKQNDKNINGLFQYDESTGTYYFDSRENFAQFDADSDTFTLFKQNISPNFIIYPFGNFLPLNNIETQTTQMSQIDRDWFIEIAKNALYRSNLIEAAKGSEMVFSWAGLSFHDNIFLSGEPNANNIENLGFAAFEIDYVNSSGAITNECWLITENVGYDTAYNYGSSWLTAVILKPTSTAGVYEVYDRVVGDGSNLESVRFKNVALENIDGLIVLLAHTDEKDSYSRVDAQRRNEIASMQAGQKVSFIGIDIASDGTVTTSGTPYFYTASGTSNLVIAGEESIKNKCPNNYLSLVFAIRSMVKNVDAYAKTTQWTYTDLVKRYFKSIDATLFADFVFPENQAENIFCIDFDEAKNFFFGMDMTFKFIQPKDGLTGPTGEDRMIYRFSGDDDVWVYLDDILFLDLSGIHRHVGGTIDFTNGIVTYNQLLPSTGDVDYDNPVQSMTKTFEQILKEANFSDTQIKQMLSEKGGFKDYSEHVFKFYYMERGSGSGVCRMEFNVPLIRSNSITVSKEVDAGDTEVLGNPDYYFQILHADDEASLYFGEGTEFTVISDANPSGYTAVVGENGIFTLKAGQTAVFSALESGGDYVVRELFDADVYQQYGDVTITVNGTPSNSQYTTVLDTIKIDGVFDSNDTGWHDNDWITVSPVNGDGIYQNEDYSDKHVKDFRYQVRNDGEKVYFAVEYFGLPLKVGDSSLTGNNDGTNIRIWTHDNEDTSKTYTKFYDIFVKESQVTGYTAWVNALANGNKKEQIQNSSIFAASTTSENSWRVEFSIDLKEIGGDDKDFSFFFNITDKFTVVTQSAETSDTEATTTETVVTKVLLYPAVPDKDHFPYYNFTFEKALDSNDSFFAMKTHIEYDTSLFKFSDITIDGVNYKYVKSDVINISDGSAAITFTNVVDESKLGKFIIEKELTDEITSNKDVEFRLNVTLDGAPMPIGTPYTYIDAENNESPREVTAEGEITIGPDCRVEFDNLLIGTTYTVKELGALEMGYDVHYHHGSLEEDTDMTEENEATVMINELGATCTLIVHNVKDGVKVFVNGEKTLGYTNGTDNVFDFTLTQVDENRVPVAGGTVMTSSVTIASGTKPFNFVISYPAESTDAGTYYYLIEESGAKENAGMDTTQYLLTVVITFDSGKMEAAYDLVKVGSEETVETASFYNDIYQALTINKEILGFYDGGAFEFTITAYHWNSMLTGEFPCINPDGSRGSITFTASKATVKLNDNESITVYLPYDTTWTVTETGVTGCNTQVGLSKDRLGTSNTLSGTLTEDKTVYFVNVFGDELPSTGSNLRLIITCCGIGLVAIAFIGACAFRISRKRRNRK